MINKQKNLLKISISKAYLFSLLHRILDQVQVEPPWVETERCQITDEKFGMRLRKHHCRHCGRAVCEKVRYWKILFLGDFFSNFM